jgi:phosphomannomutase
MVQKLEKEHPAQIGGEKIIEVSTMDGVKYIFADDSWLLIRPSGTEPVLRVYAEGRSDEMVKSLMKFGETIAASIT